MNKAAIIVISLILVMTVGLGGCAVTGIEPEPSQESERTPAPAPTLIADTPNLCLSPVEGNVGTEIMVIGTGFIAGKEVTISYDDIVVATAKVDDRDSFLTSFIVTQSLALMKPARIEIGEVGGKHAVTATDGINTVTATFYMDRYPPPTPWPILPGEGTRAVSRTYFEWGDVRDPSGVTYNLQICTNQNFRDENLVLEKRGLNVPEYTLSRGERLESTGKGNPYYWRVSAVDGAENMSDWSIATSFYVD